MTPQKESIPPHSNYKDDWAKEDILRIKHLEDELKYFNERLEIHCFNPPMYSKLAGFIKDLETLIDKEKKEYEQSYSKAYIRPLN